MAERAHMVTSFAGIEVVANDDKVFPIRITTEVDGKTKNIGAVQAKSLLPEVRKEIEKRLEEHGFLYIHLNLGCCNCG